MIGAATFSTMNTIYLDQLPSSPSKKVCVISYPIISLPSYSPYAKLSIYPEPDAEVLLVETHSELEHQIGQLRVQGTQIYDQSRGAVQSAISRWIGVEEAVESEPFVSRLHPGALIVCTGIL